MESEENRGSYECPVCGHDSPHAHSAEEIEQERVIRPLFERAYFKALHDHGKILERFRSSGWGYDPANRSTGKAQFSPSLWGSRWYARNSWGNPFSYWDATVEAAWRFFVTSYRVITSTTEKTDGKVK